MKFVQILTGPHAGQKGAVQTTNVDDGTMLVKLASGGWVKGVRPDQVKELSKRSK